VSGVVSLSRRRSSRRSRCSPQQTGRPRVGGRLATTKASAGRRRSGRAIAPKANPASTQRRAAERRGREQPAAAFSSTTETSRVRCVGNPGASIQHEERKRPKRAPRLSRLPLDIDPPQPRKHSSSSARPKASARARLRYFSCKESLLMAPKRGPKVPIMDPCSCRRRRGTRPSWRRRSYPVVAVLVHSWRDLAGFASLAGRALPSRCPLHVGGATTTYPRHRPSRFV
jgi:hypothetical protein